VSKVCLITDSHFCWKADSIRFHEYFNEFYSTVFFPELERRKISTIIHLGDLFDKRVQGVNLHILQRTRKDFLEKLADYDTHIMIGNHDCYFKNTNEVNSVQELVKGRYPRVKVYEEPEEVSIGGLRMLFLPWLNSSNMETGLDMIKRSKSSVVMGHLEIAGFNYDRVTTCNHGLDRKVFSKFKKVLSGHFHTRSKDKNIEYLGSPYQLTFADMGDDRGFHIFDTETLELEFIKNPFQMFHRIVYDDRDVSLHKAMLAEDFSKYKNRTVKVVVVHKTDAYLYDQYMTRLEVVTSFIQPIDSSVIEVSEEVESQFGDPEKGEVLLSDTRTILHNYVDGMVIEIKKDRLKDILDQLWVEAVNVVNE
jgi:DNA repair exonuclease SbcCD nuclease subunit